MAGPEYRRVRNILSGSDVSTVLPERILSTMHSSESMDFCEGWHNTKNIALGCKETVLIRWAGGETSRLKVTLPEPAGDIQLELLAAPFIFKGCPHQEITVLCNEQLIGKKGFPGLSFWEKIIFTIAKQHLHKGENDICFKYAYSVQPSSVSPNPDDRLLAVVFRHIAVEGLFKYSPGTVKLGKEYRIGLPCPIPSRLSFKTAIPGATALKLGFGLDYTQTPQAPASVKFQIYFNDGSGDNLIFEKSTAEYGYWQDVEIPIKNSSEKNLEFILETIDFPPRQGNGNSGARAYWADPIILGQRVGRERPSNVIFISLDSLRPDHLHCYGYGRKDISTFIDSLAGKGILFEEAISQAPWTTPSHMSMFTGMYPSHHGVNQSVELLLLQLRRRFPELKHHRYRALPDDRVTIAEVFRRNGYITKAFCGGVGITGGIGFARGFQSYEENDFTSDESISNIEKWLDECGDYPFFLFLHTYRIHAPYCDYYFARECLTDKQIEELKKEGGPLDADYSEKFCDKLKQMGLYKKDIIEKLYDGGIRKADKKLAEIAVFLEKKNISDSTIIAVTGDHGEEFGERNPDSIFNKHGHTLYDEIIKVPLILYAPRNQYGAKRIKNQVRLIDIMPTLCNLAGIDFDESSIDGFSLVPIIKGEETSLRPAFSEAMYTGPEKKTIRRPPFKYTYTFKMQDDYATRSVTSDHPDEIELYDLYNDPGEKHNLAHSEPGVCAELQGLINQTLGNCISDGMRGEMVAPDKDVARHLRALGYMG